jgi:serine/threonine protein kinase
MTLQDGSALGPYRILSRLGVGGMGEVYRAHDDRLDRDVAVKILAADVADDPERLERFEREARASAALNHANIVAVHDIGRADDVTYLVMELLDGATLREELESRPPTTRKAVQWTVGIAEGLAAAHAKGIVHRDIKPENLIVTTDGRIKILDFGIARFTAPEQNAPDAATAAAGTEQAVPPSLDRIERRCLEKRPEDRFHSVHDLALALEAVSGSQTQPGVALPAPASRSGRWRTGSRN